MLATKTRVSPGRVDAVVDRLRSTNDAAAMKVDPDNRLLWRMNRIRLDAEALAAIHAADSPSLQPPQHIGKPRPEHTVTNRAFAGIPSMAVAPNGRMWATWYAGLTPAKDLNNYVVLSTSGDKLNDLLQRHLMDNEAIIPMLNPNFGKAAPDAKAAPKKKAAAPDDLPGGWKNRAGAAAVRDGILSVQSKGANSFLGVAAGLTTGTARFSFRVRAPQAGEGKVALLNEAGATETLSVPYKVAGESEWETVTLELPVKEKAGILRVYLPSGSASVDFADIVLTPPQGKPRRWTF